VHLEDLEVSIFVLKNDSRVNRVKRRLPVLCEIYKLGLGISGVIE